MDALSFSVEGTNFDEKIKCWPDWTGGRIYVFLPSYAAGKPLTMEWEYAERPDDRRGGKGKRDCLEGV